MIQVFSCSSLRIKSISRNAKLISVAPDDILGSYEAKRSVCARNRSLFTSVLPVIQSLRQTLKSDSFGPFVSINSLVCLHNRAMTSCIRCYIFKAPNCDVKLGCSTCLKHIKWINLSSSANIFTYTMRNHKNFYLAPSFKCSVHTCSYQWLIGSTSSLKESVQKNEPDITPGTRLP